MLKQIASLVFIFICTTIAWIILGGAMGFRTYQKDSKLKGIVGQLWGSV